MWMRTVRRHDRYSKYPVTKSSARSKKPLLISMFQQQSCSRIMRRCPSDASFTRSRMRFMMAGPANMIRTGRRVPPTAPCTVSEASEIHRSTMAKWSLRLPWNLIKWRACWMGDHGAIVKLDSRMRLERASVIVVSSTHRSMPLTWMTLAPNTFAATAKVTPRSCIDEQRRATITLSSAR